MNAKELLANIHGRDSIEDHELMILRTETRIDELESEIMTVKEELTIQVDGEYARFIEEGNMAEAAGLSDRARRDAVVKRRMAAMPDVMDNVNERCELRLALRMAEISLRQMERDYQVNLPAIQKIVLKRYEKKIGDHCDTEKEDESREHESDFEYVGVLEGSIEEVIAALEGQREKMNAKKEKEDTVTAAEDVQYT